MLDKKLQDIQAADLQELVTNAVCEGRTIEFKQALPGNSDQNKREFLADISSFANSIGGNVVYGIREEKGCAKELLGFPSNTIDDAKLRLESILRTGLEPQIRFEIHQVSLDDGNQILLLRIKKSWIGPHRVTFRSHDKFYGRNSAGKFPMSVSELRDAFNLTDSILQRIASFRTERISEISNGIAPVTLSANGIAVVHLIPLESFEPATRIDLGPLVRREMHMRPISTNGWDHRHTFEGSLTYQGGDPESTQGYVHTYHSGIVEAVVSNLVDHDPDGKRVLFDWMYEKEIPNSVREYLAVLRKLGVNCPIYVFLTFTGVKDCIPRSSIKPAFSSPSDKKFPLRKDVLDLPGATIEDWESVNVGAIFRPMFDMVWNACGFSKSSNVDDDGNWIAG